MADIAKIVMPDNTEYDIKDTVARSTANSKYSKPAGGIPKTDMTTSVQTTLDKADSAYQKPSGGIPAGDLAEEYYLASNPAGYTTNTGTVTSVKISAGGGIAVSSTSAITTSGTRTITNTGVRAVSTGTTNGTISVNTNGTDAEVAVAGLKSAAYTESSDYAPAVHTHAYIPTSEKGAANGVAELDANGLVPTSQLPSYVDDVLEYSSRSDFPATGSSGKIYVDLSTNLTYRWGGTEYVEISPSLALGTTSTTAFRGDYGQSAYTHSVTNKGNEFASGLYKITTNSEGHVTAATAVVKADITALGIPGSDTNNEVTQTATTTDADYEVLFSATADNTTRTEGARKTSTLTFNPDSKTLTVDSGTLTGTQYSGNAATATKLAATKDIQVALGSTSAVAFDGSADVTPGVSGTLGVGNGGTGETTAKNAANAFINALDADSTDPVDDDLFVSQYVNGGTTTTTYHRRPLSKLWNYIKSKITSTVITDALGYVPPETDNKVYQSSTSTSNWRNVLLHYNTGSSSTASVSTATAQVYAVSGISVQPSTKTLRATAYNVADGVTLQYDSTNQALNFVF